MAQEPQVKEEKQEVVEDTTANKTQNKSSAAEQQENIGTAVASGVASALMGNEQVAQQQIPGITPAPQEEIPGITPVQQQAPQDALSRMEQGQQAFTPEETQAMQQQAQQKAAAGIMTPEEQREQERQAALRPVSQEGLEERNIATREAGPIEGEQFQQKKQDLLKQLSNKNLTLQERQKITEELETLQGSVSPEEIKGVREGRKQEEAMQKYNAELQKVNQYNQDLQAKKQQNPELYGDVPFMDEPDPNNFGIKDPAATPADQITPEQAKDMKNAANMAAEGAEAGAAAVAKKKQDIANRQQQIEKDIINDVEQHEKQVRENPTPEQKTRRNKFLSALSIAFGSLGSALTGQPNVGLKLIEQSIEKEIADKKLDEQAKLREQNRMWQEAKLANERIALSTNQQKVKNEALRYAKEIEQKQLENMQRQKISKMLIEGFPEAVAKVGDDTITYKEQIPVNVLKPLLSQMSPEEAKSLRNRLLPGSIPNAMVEATVVPQGEMKKTLDETAKFQGAMQDMVKAFMQFGAEGKIPATEAQSIMESYRNSIVGLARVPITGPGILTEVEVKRIMDTIGDPTGIWTIPDNVMAKMATTIVATRRGTRRLYNNVGAKLPEGINERLAKEVEKKAGASYKTLDPEVKRALGTKGMSNYKPKELSEIQATMRLLKTGKFNFNSLY